MEDPSEVINPQETVCQFDKRADAVVEEISPEECEHLQAFTGLDGLQQEDCTDLSKLICDIKQEVDAINIDEAITIYANDASKCNDDDLPTLASVFSRILRYVQAATCVLCAYDPRLATILMQGKYPEILMGSVQAGGYPQWVKPDEEPMEGSIRPVQSAGIYKAVQDAILAVWHLWAEHPAFDYFAQTLDSESDLHNLVSQGEANEGATALVAAQDGKTSLLYKYTNGEWVFERELTPADNLVNFAVTHINSGYYTENGVYYFDGTWQVMDADFSALEQKVSELEVTYDNAVSVVPGSNPVLIATAATLEEAKAYPCDPEKDTVILITG